MKQGNQFADADLVSDLSWLTRNANRANVTMYTIDPRGLVGMPDLDEKIDMVEWQNYVRTSQDSLRTIAELTGGYAAVNQNDFDKALQADRRRDERLLRHRVLLQQSGSAKAQPRDRDQGDASRSERDAPQGVHARTPPPAPRRRSRRVGRHIFVATRLLYLQPVAATLWRRADPPPFGPDFIFTKRRL